MSTTITMTSEQLQAAIAEGVKLALAQVKAPKGTPVHMIPGASAAMSERSIANAIATVKAFKKRGFGDVKPQEDVKTYDRWIAAGRKVKVGESCVKVRNLRLFHISQTSVLSGDDKAAALEKMKAAIAAHNAKKAGVAQPAA